MEQDDQYDYAYDADGNLASKTGRSSSDTTTYTFDADIHLTQIDLSDTTIITYAYDPFSPTSTLRSKFNPGIQT